MSKRVLLVEDNDDHLELIQRSFESMGDFEILTAGTITQAKEILNSTKLDLVITDWRLPDGEGQDLFPQDDHPNYALIIMTSHGNEQLAVEVMKHGAMDYVVKNPDSLSNLAFLANRTLREWDHILERRRAEEENFILQKQLNQAQKLEAIGTLAGGIAHDFNNILSGIMGYADLSLMRLESESELGKNVAEIKKACLRAADLVRQILTFSRQSEPEIRPTQVQYVVKEALKLMRGSLPSTVEIISDIDTTCPPVLADTTQIHQVITNLCTNAHHALGLEGGILTVGIKQTTIAPEGWPGHPEIPPQNYVHLWVQDNGCGISPEILDRIFEPFFTTKGPGKGTGLGLSTVHGIISRMKGHLVVSSELGKGTRFDIFLPPVLVHKEVEEVVHNPREPLQTGAGNILYVDDEEMLVRIGHTALEKQGFVVKSFIDPSKAWDEFQKNPELYDLLIADQTMPHMTGMALSEKVRDKRPDMAVILCSGYSEVLNEDYALEHNLAYIRKPMIIRELIELVNKQLNSREK